MTRDWTEAVSGACPSGRYCPAGTTFPIGCEPGLFCPAGSSAGTACSTLGVKGLTSSPGASVCELRALGVSIRRIPLARSVSLELSNSWRSNTLSDDVEALLGACGGGTYCPRGAVEPTSCPARSFCPALSGAATACPAWLLSAAGASALSGCDTRWVNVTVTGVDRSRAWAQWLPGEWGARAGKDEVVSRVAVCPAGRYCPAGSREPVMCVPGSYSAAAGSSSASVCGACEAGHYCPDPGQRYPCPNHTASTAGSASQLGCKCKKGAICLYARQLQVSVILPVSLGRWLSDAGLRASAVRAIAMSAGTNESSVWLARAAAAAAVPRGHRRLLERSPHHTVVRAAVQNGEAFHGLEALLGEAHPGLRDARVHWTPGSRVRVLGGTAFSKGIPYI